MTALECIASLPTEKLIGMRNLLEHFRDNRIEFSGTFRFYGSMVAAMPAITYHEIDERLSQMNEELARRS